MLKYVLQGHIHFLENITLESYLKVLWHYITTFGSRSSIKVSTFIMSNWGWWLMLFFCLSVTLICLCDSLFFIAFNCLVLLFICKLVNLSKPKYNDKKRKKTFFTRSVSPTQGEQSFCIQDILALFHRYLSAAYCDNVFLSLSEVRFKWN